AVQAKPSPPAKASTPRKSTPNPAASAPALSDAGVLRLLENAPASAASAASAPIAGAAHEAAATKTSAERPCFAVQLVWSVRPIAMPQVPQLAIFSAYTLYGAEGNRDGRRWYGLRLGFFTDAVSAKQVAHYVRGDFATVSVVPVTAREREQALTAAARPKDSSAAAAAPSKRSSTTRPPAKTEEFAFIDDEPVQIRDAQPSGPVPPAAAAAT